MISISEFEDCMECGEPAKFKEFGHDEMYGHLAYYTCSDSDCQIESGYNIEDVKDPTGLHFTYDYILKQGG